jgi:Spx/MgsR family transcriptional regulator
MITLYGIKNCDTVKKAKKWLDANGINYSYHDFRTDGITSEMVENWLRKSSLETVINKRSTTWKALDDSSKSTLNMSSAAALCAKHETLIKRPVLDIDGEIHLGFSEALYSQHFNL